MAVWKPSRHLEELLDQAWSDAEEQGLDIPSEDEGRWPHLLAWLVIYLESPSSDRYLWQNWRQMVRTGEAPPSPLRRDYDPVIYVKGWISARQSGHASEPPTRWTERTKAAWRDGALRGEISNLD